MHFQESNLRHLHLAGVPVETLTHYTNPPPQQKQRNMIITQDYWIRNTVGVLGEFEACDSSANSA